MLVSPSSQLEGTRYRSRVRYLAWSTHIRANCLPTASRYSRLNVMMSKGHFFKTNLMEYESERRITSVWKLFCETPLTPVGIWTARSSMVKLLETWNTMHVM